MSYSPAFSQAIEILVYIEMKSSQEYYQYCSAPKIAEGLNIPLPSIKRLIAMLKKANLLISKKGITGGLALAKTPETISLYDVLSAIEGQSPLFPIYQNFNVEDFADKDDVQRILGKSQQIFQSIDQNMRESLQAVSLAELLSTENEN